MDLPGQLLLFPPAEPLDEAQMASFLERGVGAPVRLTLTRNRTSVLTFKRATDGAFEVRLQRVFLEAPDDILNAVVNFVRRPTRATREQVVSYFTSRPDTEKRARRPAPPGPEDQPRGRVHDLAAIRDDLNARYFGGEIDARITWGAAGKGGGRSIRFGSYLAEERLIRIHPTLDSESVPRFFVESIVHHEMLHAVIPIERDEGSGRRCIHPPEFHERERRFEKFDEAAEWERENLRKLLAGEAIAEAG
jgi:hypothetical protein